MVKNWPAEEGECKPSVVCQQVAEASLANYHQVADCISALLHERILGIDPNTPNLSRSYSIDPKVRRKRGLYIQQEP